MSRDAAYEAAQRARPDLDPKAIRWIVDAALDALVTCQTCGGTGVRSFTGTEPLPLPNACPNPSCVDGKDWERWASAFPGFIETERASWQTEGLDTGPAVFVTYVGVPLDGSDDESYT